MPADVKANIRHAATLIDSSLSEFVVNSALKAAEETIRTHDVTVLTPRDSIKDAETLPNPKKAE